ncbi:MAG: conserved membrane protein of unknown function [Promethearchaeota archaeon]|nr:MAG: conserved membrane protein of unknown function [Candidatus Lokiarchaeota archaeon]
MSVSTYLLGVMFALSSGISRNLGLLLQKNEVNKIRTEDKMIKKLTKNPLWISAIFLQMGLGSIFYILAQIFIGPALIPGLLASGLIILTFGSVHLIGEELSIKETLAIVGIITAISLIGFSGLSIDIRQTDFLNLFFTVRLILFTVSFFSFAIIFEIIQRKREQQTGIYLALISGLMFSLTNLWISPLIGVFGRVFSGNFLLEELIYFILSSILVIVTMVLGVVKLAQGFKYGQASHLVPIQNVPLQISPAIIYFFVFLLIPPNFLSVFLFLTGIIMILIGSIVLGKNQSKSRIF